MEQAYQEGKLLKAAKEFVRKCEAGEARSIKSYEDFKEAIAELESEPALTPNEQEADKVKQNYGVQDEKEENKYAFMTKLDRKRNRASIPGGEGKEGYELARCSDELPTEIGNIYWVQLKDGSKRTAGLADPKSWYFGKKLTWIINNNRFEEFDIEYWLKPSLPKPEGKEEDLWKQCFDIFLNKGDVYSYDYKAAVKEIKSLGIKIIKE